MALPEILVYSHEWHLTRSGAFDDLLIEPLRPYAHITQRAWLYESVNDVPTAPVIAFCQVLPPNDWMNKQTARLVWLPMWDAVWHLPQTWWNALPKSLKIVAFSQAVAQRARAAELSVLEVQYFKNPADFAPVAWDGERVLYYWNRRGLVGPAFLERMCAALKIDRLLFRPDIDPQVDAGARYTLPARLGSTTVEHIETTASREDYWKRIAPANIVIAPRLHEGAGMVFLEALARGCAVFAHNAPTMSEYIEHGANGVLLNRRWSIQRFSSALRWRLAQRGVKIGGSFQFLLPEQQNWDALAALDLAALGQQARATHVAGYVKWQAQQAEYAHFLLE
jgi:hypothetical protein